MAQKIKIHKDRTTSERIQYEVRTIKITAVKVIRRLHALGWNKLYSTLYAYALTYHPDSNAWDWTREKLIKLSNISGVHPEILTLEDLDYLLELDINEKLKETRFRDSIEKRLAYFEAMKWDLSDADTEKNVDTSKEANPGYYRKNYFQDTRDADDSYKGWWLPKDDTHYSPHESYINTSVPAKDELRSQHFNEKYITALADDSHSDTDPSQIQKKDYFLAVISGKTCMLRGNHGIHIKFLQEALVELGFNLFRYETDVEPVIIDAKLSSDPIMTYSSGTERAVRAFQRSNGLIGDGVVNSETLEILDSFMYTRENIYSGVHLDNGDIKTPDDISKATEEDINNSKLFIEKAYDTFDTTGFLSWLTSGANTDKAIRFMQTQLSSNWDDFLSELQDIKPLAFQQKYNLKRLFINTKNFDDKQKIFEYRFNKTVDTKEGAVWKDSLLNLIYSQLDSLPDMVTMENEALKGIILRPELKSNKGESLKGVYIWRQNWFYELIDDIGNLIPWTDLMGYQGYIFISEKAANLTDLDIIYHELGHAIDNNLTAEKWYKNRFFYQINWQSWNIDKLESWLTDMDIEHETPLVQERIRDFYSKRINDPTSTTSLNLDGIENTETPILVTAFINSAPNPYQHVQHLPSINGRSYLFGLKDTKLYSFNAELLEFPAFIDRNEPNSYCMHTPFDWFAEQFTCHALGGIVAPWVEEWFYKKFKPGT